MLSVLILLISQSVIRCSGSPHCGLPLSETYDVVHNVFLYTQCMTGVKLTGSDQYSSNSTRSGDPCLST